MLKAAFPVYALRAYNSVSEEGMYVLVHTPFDTYVLDCKGLEGDYFSRRTQMLAMELPYKMYPLREQLNTISQIANSKRRDYIDRDGKLWKYKPSKFYNVKYVKVLAASRTWNGYYLLMTKLPVQFVTEIVPKYIGYIQVGAAIYLYDLSDELKPATKKKL